MDRDERRALNLLEASCELRNQAEIRSFEEALADLRESREVETLRGMLRCFRDVEAGELQYELVEAVESYPDEVYVETLVEETPRMVSVSPFWHRLLFQSMLNTAPCLQLVEAVLPTKDETTRRAVIQVTTEIAAEDPDYRSIGERLTASSQ